MPRTPLRGTAVGVCPAARPVLFPLLDRTLAYADRFPPTDDRSYGAEGAVCVFAGLLLRPYPSSSPAVVRKLAERRVRLWEAGDAVRAGFSVCGMQQLWRESRDGSELHNYQMEAGDLPTTTSRSARRRKRRRSARARAAAAEAAEGGADAAADGVPPAVVDAHRRAAKLTAVQELRRARQALDTADLGMVSDVAAALPALDALHPPPAATSPEYSPPEEPPDLQRAPPSWGDNADEVMRWGEDQRRVLRRAPRLSAGHVDWWRWEHIRDLDVPSWRLCVNRCLAGRCHSRTAAFLASGSVFALHKDDPAAREEREKRGEPLRVRPLGVGSVLVRLASAHALGQVGADAREVMGPSFADDCGAATAAAHVPRVFDEYCTELSKVGLVVQDSKTRYVRHPGDSESELRTVREKLAPGGFRTPADDPVQDGAVYLGAPISHYPEWMTGALGRRREAHATLLERIASFGTSGYGCHHGAMRLLVVCAVRQTGFLSRMMPPSELDTFLEAVDAANISAAFSLLGLDACDQSTPRMEAAIVQMSMPADFGGLNLALLQSEAPAAFYSAQSVVLPKLVREYGPALGPLYEAVRAEVSSVATSALPWARETRRVYETVRALTTLPQEDVRRARAAYGHAHEIFELLTVSNATTTMSEVASMYLQGRLPGWFNRLFASARLVAPVKKLGEGRAPDVRPVAVGEAERRAAERAVVDNMKEAYVSVLAPSQLGVGIPAGDSVLIHGVRLIAEKLGPRAVIVHTDLRNAYNEAWRRTIIQRHIDCSPLHPVIPALLASLSTDSYLVVDDRSAPLRSEDGVQQGAPLATTSFCVAIHPEVQQCDTTLEVNDGAARFNADDGILVGLPEHVWPALHAFRTSIKASVGLEVRFDKMQAYSADMEAARREAPADIEWPELDGHHGIAVLNVPLGSPEYVQAYMRGKAEELREEVDASLSKLLSAKPSRRYTHALHHHAWALLKHCMQHKAGYWLRNCLPSEVEAFAEAVDATILAAVERVLGVSFDPSTYGTDTNPVVTDFLAELLHDPDPMAAEVATLSEDAVARARSRLHLPTRLKGAGIRRMATVRDAAFIGCMNAILPRFLTKNSGTNTPTPGFFDPQLGSVLGRGSFNANSSARQYDHFLNDAHGSDSYAAEMREAWGRLQAATAGHLGDADARQMEREVEAASGSQKELTAFLDQANNSRLRNEVCALPATCRERILFNQLDAASGMWTVAIPTARTAMTPHELREVAAGYFFLPSPCLAPVVGCQIILPSTEHNPVIVDLYGDALMNLPAPGDAHWRVQHDAIADAFRDHCVHDLGIAVRREVDDLFQQAVPLGNTVPRDELKDLVPDAELSLPAFNVVTGSYDPRSLKSTLLEFKTMRYGVKYTSVPRATAVDRFERSLLGDIQRGLAARDAAWHNTEPGHKGPLRDILDMSEYTGMVFGTVANYKHRMHTALKNLWASVAIDAGAVLDRDRSGAGDLTLETSGLRPADRSRPSDLTLAGWGGAACDYMIDFACVSSTTPTWSNDPRWCIPGIAATEAEHAKLAADRASSAPVQGVHRYYPFVVEDRGRLGKSALTVVYIFAVLLAVRNFPGSPSAPTSCFLRGQSVQALRNFVAGQPAEFRRHLSRTWRGLLQRVSACVHGTLGGILSAGDAVVALVEDGELFRAAGWLSSKGRLPGWFNRLFAYTTRLVAAVKKQGEGGAPDVRPIVAVGEAERRAVERAVVDNMKEA
eukprot:jgi/Tetstr1/432710/TSEL_022077.t1